MKTILVSLALVAFATPALADKAKPPSKPAAKKKPNFGESFELKGRYASRPRDVEPAIVKNVIASQPRVLEDKIADVEYCWLKLPAAKRVASAAVLKVTIEAAGTVTSAHVEGRLPAGVGKCITSVATRWSFPVGDARSEIEHGITLTTR